MSQDSALALDIGFDSPEELERAWRDQISKGGYFVPSDDPLPRTSPVELRFNLPGLEKPLVLKGEVAFSAGRDSPMPGMGTGMAVQFSQSPDEVEKAFSSSIAVARSKGMDAGGASEEPDEEEGEEFDEVQEDEESTSRLLANLSTQSSENLYFTIKKMSLHQKFMAAKRGNRAVRAILLREGHKKVLRFLLQNPQFSTPEVVQMLKAPNVPIEIVQAIAKNSTWSQSEEVKYQIVTNPKSPLPLVLNLLPSLNQNSLAKLAKSGAVKVQIKSSALKLLEQRRKQN